MPGRRPRLPVLAEIAGPGPDRQRTPSASASDSAFCNPEGDKRQGPWSLRRHDFDRLQPLGQRLASQRVLLVSGDGGVTGVLAVALAGAAAAAGRRTVLVECDLARPALAADLGLAEAPGLHEYLRWEATAPQLLQPLALGGSAAAGALDPLVCITAGREAADPATLLGLGSFRHMTGKLRRAYELVVLAGPPLDGDPAALAALAAEADGLLAALPASGSRRRAVRGARARLRRLPAPALGAVVVGEG